MIKRGVIEIFEKDYPDNKQVLFTYSSKYFYDVSRKLTTNGWIFELKVKEFYDVFEKKQMEELFQPYKENTRYFSYHNQNGHEIGVISIGKQEWNNVCRIWDIYIQSQFQKLGIGSELVKYAEKLAVEWKCRAIVVECQSSNFPAIKFYMKNGFTLAGFDLYNYSNDDQQNHEVRLEMIKLMD
jgi:ribosomal protein S18 acetylase RimI-like enzyme